MFCAFKKGAHSPRKCAIFCGNDANLEKITIFEKIKKNPEPLIYQRFQDLFVAGAEGLEPSARGFGDRCSTN